MLVLDHRKIIGASDLDGYARTVVTEGIAEMTSCSYLWIKGLDRLVTYSIPQFQSVESPVQLDVDGGLPHRYGIGNSNATCEGVTTDKSSRKFAK